MSAQRSLAIVIAALALPGSTPALGQSVTRAISLEEIGLRNGVEFSGMDGSRTLHFPIGDPSDVQSAALTLPFETQTAFPANRQVTLRVAGRALATRRFADSESGVWRVPVPASLMQGRYLAATLEYSGSRIGAQCVDTRIGGDWIRFGSAAEAKIVYARSAMKGAARALGHAPGSLVIELPALPSEAQVAGALLLSATRPTRFGPASESGDWRETRVVFAEHSSAALSVIEGPRPAFAIGDPLAAPRLFSRTADYRGSAMPTTTAALGETSTDNRAAISLGTLDADLAPRMISDRGGWTVPLPATRVPSGRALSGLVADLVLADDGEDAPAVVTIALNGLLLASRPAMPGERSHLSVSIPEGLATTDNRIDVSVLRQERGSDCNTLPIRQEARLLGSSHAVLAKADAVADFHDLPAAFAGGVTLVLPAQPDSEKVAAIAGLLGGMLSATTPLSVQFGGAVPEGSVIWLSDSPPPGTRAPLDPSSRTRIRGVDGTPMVDAATLADASVVQLLAQGGRPVLWIRPGREFTKLAGMSSAARLGYGDIALYDGSGRLFAMHSEREKLVDIQTEGEVSLADWMRENRIWLVLGAWLLVSALFAWLLRQTYLSRDRGDDGDG